MTMITKKWETLPKGLSRLPKKARRHRRLCRLPRTRILLGDSHLAASLAPKRNLANEPSESLTALRNTIDHTAPI